ncbi:MAG: cupin domain-containing protein [Armatimonadota bacterium]|nr:cupin domain-containing protein [Armatimonadota bacterium]MDR7550682.1 cupin domain-containing protein [Armatimonadota bacterium]
MRGSMKDLPLALEVPEGKIWQVEWGGNTVEFGQFNQTVDPAPFFKGLPDDRCQCPHWGYVIKGRLRYRFKDREEIYEAGDVYYAPPGHTPVLEAGVEYVELSPTKELAKTMEVIERNMQMTNQARMMNQV